MLIKSIAGLLIVLVGCSGDQQSSNGGLTTDSGLFPKAIRIDNGINRGIGYTDTLGADYNLRYIPITIRNDSTISIHLQIAFSMEYNFPHLDSNDKFKVIPLPKEWALDGVGVTEGMMDELPHYIERPVFNATIKPGETCTFSIGTLYPNPPKMTGVLPRTLFTHLNSGMFPTCEWLMKKYPSSQSQMALGLKLVYGENCIIIPCGQASYS